MKPGQESISAAIHLRVIGRIRTPFVDAPGTPIQPAFARDAEGQVIVDEPYASALFMVYLHSGYTRKRALFLDAVTSLTSVIGAVLGYFCLSRMRSVGPYLLAFAAAGFLYVALADLIPAQRGRMSLGLTLLDLLLVVGGIGVIALVAHGPCGASR